jgi:p-hydroxybenzoate 3-monooxygenase
MLLEHLKSQAPSVTLPEEVMGAATAAAAPHRHQRVGAVSVPQDRAGRSLEQTSTDLLIETGVGERMLAEGAVHDEVNLQFNGERHRIDFARLTGGRHITVYGQQEVVKDLIAARLDAGGTILFVAADATPKDIAGEHPAIAFPHQGIDHELACDVIAGCDGFHGVCRGVIPAGVLSEFGREYPFGWLGVLATVAPSTDELIYAFHERGFALHSLRSPELSRLYVQVDPSDDIENWSDERIWEELRSFGWPRRGGP